MVGTVRPLEDTLKGSVHGGDMGDLVMETYFWRRGCPAGPTPPSARVFMVRRRDTQWCQVGPSVGWYTAPCSSRMASLYSAAGLLNEARVTWFVASTTQLHISATFFSTAD